MFILSQSKLSIESKSVKAYLPKEGYELKNQNYAIIWSQMFISSQSRISVESKKFVSKSFKAHQPKEGYG